MSDCISKGTCCIAGSGGASQLGTIGLVYAATAARDVMSDGGSQPWYVAASDKRKHWDREVEDIRRW